MEKDESEHQTATREILEETGLTVKFVEGFREIIEYSPYENCLKTVVFFLAYTDSMNVVSQEEIKEIYWFSFDEAMTALTFDSDRATVQKAEQFLAWTLVSLWKTVQTRWPEAGMKQQSKKEYEKYQQYQTDRMRKKP